MSDNEDWIWVVRMVGIVARDFHDSPDALRALDEVQRRLAEKRECDLARAAALPSPLWSKPQQ